MSQVQTLKYKGPNAALDHSTQVSGVIASGPYTGLMVSAANSGASRKVNISAGMLFTSQGIKLEETVSLVQPASSISLLEFSASEADCKRIDTVALVHSFSATPNLATYWTYAIVEGTPAATPLEEPDPPAMPGSTYYPLADVDILPGASFITNDDIFNRYRTLNTTALRDEVMSTFHDAFGNFSLIGWDVAPSVHNGIEYTVTSGTGVLDGFHNRSLITTNKADLYGQTELVPAGTVAVGTIVPTLEPDFASQLQVSLTTHTAGDDFAGTMVIHGTDYLNVARTVTLTFAQTGIDTTTQTTVARFKIFTNIVVASTTNIFTPGAPPTITVKDLPNHRIVVKGSEVGIARFRAVVDPLYTLTANEMVLAYITNIGGVFTAITVPTLPGSEYKESLACDSVVRQWALLDTPRTGTIKVVLDGLNLRCPTNGVKGCDLVGNILILGTDVETPDADTDFWVTYKV